MDVLLILLLVVLGMFGCFILSEIITEVEEDYEEAKEKGSLDVEEFLGEKWAYISVLIVWVIGVSLAITTVGHSGL